jgi:hypothetical protein
MKLLWYSNFVHAISIDISFTWHMSMINFYQYLKLKFSFSKHLFLGKPASVLMVTMNMINLYMFFTVLFLAIKSTTGFSKLNFGNKV